MIWKDVREYISHCKGNKEKVERRCNEGA